MKSSRIVLFIRRTVLTSLLLMPWIPILASQAGELASGGGIPEFLKAPQSSNHNAPITVGTPAQAGWVDEIRNSLGMYKTNYPASNFAPYVAKLDLVRDAVDRGDRRVVKTEMAAFFKMLAKRDHGISDVAADELTNFSQMVTPIEEYGIAVPRSGAGQ